MPADPPPDSGFDTEHKSTENNPQHDAANDERRSLRGQNAPSSCESARDYLAAGARAIRAASPHRSRFAAEFEALLDYVAQNGLEFPAHLIPDPAPASGQEHGVWPAGDTGRVYKATWSNRFGLTIGGAASPLQYFERLCLANRVFGDDIAFEGVAKVAGKIRVVTSQRFIVGEVPEPQEVSALLEAMGFLSLELAGQTAWYRPADNVLAFDAHTKNFVRTVGGILPIDVILLQDDAMKATILPGEVPPPGATL
jgi:hypothetical protein